MNFFTWCSFWQLFRGPPLPDSLLLLLISFCTRENYELGALISDAPSILQVPEESWICQCWLYLIATEFQGDISKPIVECYLYSVLAKSSQSHRNSSRKKFKAPIFYMCFENISDRRAGNTRGAPASPCNKGQHMLFLTANCG